MTSEMISRSAFAQRKQKFYSKKKQITKNNQTEMSHGRGKKPTSFPDHDKQMQHQTDGGQGMYWC